MRGISVVGGVCVVCRMVVLGVCLTGEGMGE